VHMNGCLFDPRLGRFMQADPFIQNPLNRSAEGAIAAGRDTQYPAGSGCFGIPLVASGD